MAAATHTPDGGAGAPDPALLARPLEFLVVEHLRQRDLCALLDEVAAAEPVDRARAAYAARRIARDLAIHVLDDEEDLYPLLRRRAAAEDRVEGVLGLLSGEHAAEDRSAAEIADGLAAAAAGAPLGPELKARIRGFTRRLRRHLAVENGLLMPLAEQRLTSADLDGLARRMAARRGLVLTSHAHG
jgi:hemerythrin-like domain-containing protein